MKRCPQCGQSLNNAELIGYVTFCDEKGQRVADVLAGIMLRYGAQLEKRNTGTNAVVVFNTVGEVWHRAANTFHEFLMEMEMT